MNAQGGASMLHEPGPVRASCPRCGYDLSGAVESWRESCPLEGVCSECGLELHWGRVLRLSAGPRWSCEHVVRLTMWRVLKTGVRTLRPWKFWSGLTMEDPVVPRRLGVMLFLGLPAVYVIGVLMAGVLSGVYFIAVQSLQPKVFASVWQIELDRVVIACLSWPDVWIGRIGMRSGPTMWLTFSCVLSIGVVTPWLLVLLSTTLARARIDVGHLWRCVAFMILGHAMLALLLGVLAFAARLLGSYAVHRGWMWALPPLELAVHPGWRAFVHLVWSLGMWSAFVVVYLRLKHAWGTVTLLGFLGMLISLTVWFLLMPLGAINFWYFV
ncbi:MAG: hypothetical protein ACKVZJ_00170 [Phycisphaerales bacterium]